MSQVKHETLWSAGLRYFGRVQTTRWLAVSKESGTALVALAGLADLWKRGLWICVAIIDLPRPGPFVSELNLGGAGNDGDGASGEFSAEFAIVGASDDKQIAGFKVTRCGHALPVDADLDGCLGLVRDWEDLQIADVFGFQDRQAASVGQADLAFNPGMGWRGLCAFAVAGFVGIRESGRGGEGQKRADQENTHQNAPSNVGSKMTWFKAGNAQG